MRIAVREHLVPVPPAERFTTARGLGADGLELGFGPHGHDQHLLWKPDGPAKLKTQAEAAGLALPSVFAGYFLDYPLSDPDPGTRRLRAEMLDRLLDACAGAGVGTVLLPLFGAADPQRPGTVDRLVEVVALLAKKAADRNVKIALETALSPAELPPLLARFASPAVGVAYDVAHAAALGRDAIADLKLLGDSLCQVRVRDVTADGRRAPLGQGVVDFAGIGRELARHGDTLWWVLEAAPGDDPLAATRAGVAFLRRLAGG